MNITVYNGFKLGLLSGGFNLASDNIYVALVDVRSHINCRAHSCRAWQCDRIYGARAHDGINRQYKNMRTRNSTLEPRDNSNQTYYGKCLQC